MIIVFIGSTPYDSGRWQFEEAARLLMPRDVTLHFLQDNPLFLPWQLREVAKNGAEGEKMVVHTSSPRGVVAAAEMSRLTRTNAPPVVLMADSTDERATGRLERYARSCSAFVTTAAGDDRPSRWGMADARTALIYPPVVEPTYRYPAQQDEQLWLYHGEITRDCRLEEIVMALADSPGCRLAVNGTGKGRWAMPAVRRSRAMDLEPRIHWMGADHASDLLDIPSGTIFFAPEADTPEQLTLIASYMAQGATVVAKRNADTATLIDDGVSGILLDDFSRSAITSALEGIDTGAIAAKAAECAALFGDNNMMKTLLKLYRQLSS